MSAITNERMYDMDEYETKDNTQLLITVGGEELSKYSKSSTIEEALNYANIYLEDYSGICL